MNTKKKFILITSILLLAAMTCSLFVGCKSQEEKENDYYAKAAQSIEKSVTTLNSLSEELFNKAWKANFMYAYTYYRKTNDDGTVINDCITRGDESNAGWPSGSKEYVHFMYFEVDYTDVNNYTVKTTTFEDTDRKTYYNNKDKVKNYEKKFTVIDKLTFEVKDGAVSGSLSDGFNPLFIIKASVDGEAISDCGISASDNFRIYTHFMRIESRQVFDKDGEVVTRAINDESDKAYWNNYGEDISYNWDNVYGMNNNRLTVLYSKGKKRINQLEIYNEKVISYYTKKDKVNTQLVLKADVVSYHEMVVKFEYK
ncbi:MAG: hypothetical protein K2I23_03675 [Clostridia bacterium]|nr:hypothetical protein [Clostridia bacterium]